MDAQVSLRYRADSGSDATGRRCGDGLNEDGIMGEFFRGWRRKIGCVTLLMALVFMLAWIRSLTVTDSIFLPIGKHTSIGLFSAGNSLTSLCQFDATDEFGWELFWDSTPLMQGDYDPFLALSDFGSHWHWRWQWYGFGAGGWSHDDSKPIFPQRHISMTIWIIPYWSITIPLTLVSAFLLLSKPRPSTPKKSSEPTANESGANS